MANTGSGGSRLTHTSHAPPARALAASASNAQCRRPSRRSCHHVIAAAAAMPRAKCAKKPTGLYDGIHSFAPPTSPYRHPRPSAEGTSVVTIHWLSPTTTAMTATQYASAVRVPRRRSRNSPHIATGMST